MILDSHHCVYAIAYKQKDGSVFLARGTCGTPALYFRRRDACKFRDELTPHLTTKGKVIRVSFEICGELPFSNLKSEI